MTLTMIIQAGHIFYQFWLLRTSKTSSKMINNLMSRIHAQVFMLFGKNLNNHYVFCKFLTMNF